MSFILEALKRAEQERNRGRAAVLHDVPAVRPGTPDKRYRYGLGLIVLVNAVVLVYLAADSLGWRQRTSAAVAETAPVTAVGPSPVAIGSARLSDSQAASVREAPLNNRAEPLPLRLLPARFRQSLPPLNIDIHVYSAVAERRFVLINAKRYQQGEWLDESLWLESITPDGVILEHQGQRIKLAVQPSLPDSGSTERPSFGAEQR